ncbi:MAG: universal stress protein [Chloroflexota bacterium]|nr:universal stress protein [Chloroflexota bacterium]
MFRHILVAFEGSASSRKALDVALTVAEAFRSKVSLLSVEEYVPRFPGDIGEVKEEKRLQNEYYAKIQREAREAAKLRGLDFERADLLMGHVARGIIDHAKEVQCDLIVMGHSGRSGAWASFLGSTAEKVSRYAHCTVMIVR